jgi:hypothetical protein
MMTPSSSESVGAAMAQHRKKKARADCESGRGQTKDTLGLFQAGPCFPVRYRT